MAIAAVPGHAWMAMDPHDPSGEPGHDPGPSDGADEAEERPFGALSVVVLLILVVGGLFLVFELRDMSQTQDCIWSGRRNCAPVGAP